MSFLASLFGTNFGLSYFTFEEVMLRLSLAIIMGFLIGWERDYKNKPIDFRAYMIVCATTCLVTMVAQEQSNDFLNQNTIISLDLGKVFAGVLTGIGFLGAGAIIKRDGDHIVGSATGASIWAAGGLGLALGFGTYALAFAGFATVILVLLVGGHFMPKVNGKEDREKEPC